MKKRMTGLLLAILLAVSPAAAWGEDMNGNGQQILEANETAALEEQPPLEEVSPPRRELTVEELEEKIEQAERGYADRFIVKYKTEEALAAMNAAELAAPAEQLAGHAVAALTNAKEYKMQQRERLMQREGALQETGTLLKSALKANLLTADKPEVEVFVTEALELEPVTASDVSVASWKESYQVITLNEKIEPAAFINALAQDAGETIEYIQPDYELELAAETITTPEGLTITELEEAPEIGLTVLPAASQEPEENTAAEGEASAEPSETPLENADAEPTAEATAEPTEPPEPANLPDGTGVTVAVIDTGIDITHLDLSGRVVAGYDFYNDTDSVYSEELGMEQVHGTHVAGILAQAAPGVSIMPLKCFENGRARTTDLIDAIDFAAENGASIVNCSWGSSDNNRALKEAMQASGLFFVCAAGNNRQNVDEKPVYPAGFRLDNVISVTALNADSGFSYFSNYGTQTVDIAALGRDVTSAKPGGGTLEMNGTSMSAAFVSAAAAQAKQLGEENLKQRLIFTGDKLVNLQNKLKDGRKLNVERMVSGDAVTEVTALDPAPADDFDVHGYQPTPQENWELFSSLENVQIACGNNFTVILKSDGSVWAFGANSFGQLGNGTTESNYTPTQIAGLSNIVSIAAESSTTYAIKSDGTVWGCGYNYYGHLGDGTYTLKRTTPVKNIYLTDIESVGVGNMEFTRYAIDSSGNVFSLDRGVQKTDLSNIKKICLSVAHSLALDNNGILWGWGSSRYGELLDKNSSSNPVELMSGVKDIAAGTYLTLILKNDNKVYSAGGNEYGQLGISGLAFTSTPVEIPGLNNVTKIYARQYSCLAVKNDGTVYSWGQNYSGILGIGSTNNTSSPVQLSLTGVFDASIG